MATFRVLCVGDPHFQVKNAPETDALVEKILKAIEKLKPDACFFMGDFLHRHSLIDMDPFVRVHTCIERVSAKVQVVILIGNHDRRNNSDFQTEIHSLVGLKKWPNVTIVDKALAKSFKATSRYGGEAKAVNFIFVPYVPPGRFQEALGTLNLDEKGFEGGFKSPFVDCIFAHQEFYGANMGTVGITSSAGDKWSKDWPLVVSGHIHDHHILGDNLVYVGTPMQHDFGDMGSKSLGYFEFNLDYKDDAKKLERFDEFEVDKPQPNLRCKYFRISLGLTRKVEYGVSVSQAGNFEAKKNEEVKLVVKGTVEELTVFRKSEKAKQLASKNIKVVLLPDLEKKKVGRETKDSERKDAAKSEEEDKSFLSILHDLVREEDEDKEELVALFTELFVSPSAAGPGSGRTPARRKVIIDE